MVFSWGEDWVTYFERLSYRGFIGFLYESTFGGVMAWLICGIVLILAIIGLVTVFKHIFVGGHKRSTYDQWERNRKRTERKTGSKL